MFCPTLDKGICIAQEAQTSYIACIARETLRFEVAVAVFAATLLQYLFVTLLVESIRERFMTIPTTARYASCARKVPFLQSVKAIRYTTFVLDILRISKS